MLFKRFAHIVPFMERNLVLKVINGLWQTFTLGYPTWRCSKSSAKFLHRDMMGARNISQDMRDLEP